MRASLAAGVLLLMGSIAVAQQPQGTAVGPSDYSIAVQPTTGAMPIVSSSTPTTAHWVAPGKVASPILRTSGTSGPSLVRQAKTQKGGAVGEEDKKEFQVQTEPPGLERLSQLDSDRKLEERIRQETLERTDREQVVFPEEPILSREAYAGRVGLWPVRQLVVEPNYVVHRKLFFQQLNTERYGWDLGPITPVICAGAFLTDLATVPLHFGARPCERDASTGYLLPGDPVPLMLYPPEITVTGTALEVGVVIALIAIFP